MSDNDIVQEFPGAQVEMSGSQWVTQYRGQILPLIRLNADVNATQTRLAMRSAEVAN